MRKLISLNENWSLSFPKGERLAEKVTLPHTWNAVDGMDGNGSYLRTTGEGARSCDSGRIAPHNRIWPAGQCGCPGGGRYR